MPKTKKCFSEAHRKKLSEAHKGLQTGEKNPKWKGGKLEKVCIVCRKTFHVKRYNVKARFCSVDCYAKWQSENKRGENSPAWKGGEVKEICKMCGKEFYIKPSQKDKTKFCSRTCKDKYQILHLKGENNPNWKGGKIKIPCAYCGRTIFIKRHLVGKAKFCSRKCLGKFYAKDLRRRRNIRPTGIETIFMDIIKKNNLPFKYTGDGSFWIKNINPDFVECNGKKIAIEIFGEYWHSPLKNWNLKEDRTLPYRKKILKKYGWKLVVLWQDDLEREDAEARVLSVLTKEKLL